MSKLELLAVYLAARDFVSQLKSGQQVDQKYVDRLVREVENVKIENGEQL